MTDRKPLRQRPQDEFRPIAILVLALVVLGIPVAAVISGGWDALGALLLIVTGVALFGRLANRSKR